MTTLSSCISTSKRRCKQAYQEKGKDGFLVCKYDLTVSWFMHCMPLDLRCFSACRGRLNCLSRRRGPCRCDGECECVSYICCLFCCYVICTVVCRITRNGKCRVEIHTRTEHVARYFKMTGNIQELLEGRIVRCVVCDADSYRSVSGLCWTAACRAADAPCADHGNGE